MLDRPRHEKLIEEIRETGARIRLIGDGDLSAGITAMPGSGVHAVMGTGGAPEGVITAAAMRCLGGEIFARLVVSTPEHEERCRAMGITDFKRVYRSKDLASGQNIVFAATGVTDGAIMKGVGSSATACERRRSSCEYIHIGSASSTTFAKLGKDGHIGNIRF